MMTREKERRSMMQFVRPCGVSLFLLMIWFLIGMGLSFWRPLFSLVWFLLLPSWEDLRTGYIWDFWSISLSVAGVIHSFFIGQIIISLMSGVSVLLFFSILFLLTRRSMGAGDVFFASSVATWFTPYSACLFLWFSFVSAALYGVFCCFCGKRSWEQPISFIPFLSFGGICGYVISETIWWQMACRIYIG